MNDRLYLRPTAFVDAPFGLDGKVARLAGGLLWFSAVEVIGGDRTELVPVAGIDAALTELGSRAQGQWANIIASRAPLTLGERVVRLDQPQVVGIVNVTPDSFSDAGAHSDSEGAADAGHEMATAGAAIIDVGGESTRPGAKPVWEGDEIERIRPVVERLARAGTAVSIDTRKAPVADAALAAGARLVNVVSALTFDPRMAQAVAAAGSAVVLMHHQGSPETMQDAPRYDRPVLLAVYDWLEGRIAAATAAGIARDRIIVDPGIGFGKTVQHNLALINGLSLFHGLGCPIMLGASRKRTIGALHNESPVDRRLGGSLTLALAGGAQGVQLLRVHDVFDTVQAVKVWRGLRDTALAPGLG